jgi:hypothetical protein
VMPNMERIISAASLGSFCTRWSARIQTEALRATRSTILQRSVSKGYGMSKPACYRAFPQQAGGSVFISRGQSILPYFPPTINH